MKKKIKKINRYHYHDDWDVRFIWQKYFEYCHDKNVSWTITNTLEIYEKKKGDLSKEIEDIKKNIMEILELKNIMIEVKNWIV